MKINLRPHQVGLYDKINKAINNNITKLCIQAETGFGKSVIIGKMAADLEGRTLILTHRAEILTQNADWLSDCQILTAKTKNPRKDTKIVIGMVQTLDARLKKYGDDYIGDFDNIILDECHIEIFGKVLDSYNNKLLFGLTATPVLDKKKTLIIDDEEWVEQRTLSEMFDDIVCGSSTQDLVDLGFLVQDRNIILQLPEFGKLIASESEIDGYTKKSINALYSSKASLECLIKSYKEYGVGKKTIIFNANTAINKIVFDELKKQNVNVKLIDSVNKPEINPKTEKPYTRTELIEWFNTTPAAVVVNAMTLTTGFNSPEIETVIMNRATKSLSLWVQCVGRGSRPTSKILKEFFTVVDLGGNIDIHGVWSQPRNWRALFFPAPPKRKRKMDMSETWDCSGCGAMNPAGELYCMSCGQEKDSYTQSKSGKDRDGELVELDKYPMPNANSIIAYTKGQGENANFAYKVLQNRIIGLFIHHKVTKEMYEKNKEYFTNRIAGLIRPTYFAVFRSDLEGGKRRLSTIIQKTITKSESQLR